MSGVQHTRGTSAARHSEQAQTPTHGRHGQAATHGRGQFNGYTFRLGRAPTQNPARRPQGLRSRPSAQQRAQAQGEEMQADFDLMQRAGGSDLDDDERRRRPPVGEADRKWTSQQGERPPAPPSPQRLKARVPPAAPPAPPLAARLQQAGWPGADVLWSQSPQRPTEPQLVQALVAGLLAAALPAHARPGAAGSGTVLRMALMAAFQRSGAGTQELCTLAKVKDLVMSHRATQPPRPHDAPLSDAVRSANVLAIPQLLNMARPRTPTQRRQAIDRQELLSRSPRLQGTRA
ncbi:MAG TPA: hypothetical protein VFL86_01005 [Burkholderiaceae bacterium]|nr:hypothetical protein [Burkholderiaceae bacterium]